MCYFVEENYGQYSNNLKEKKHFISFLNDNNTHYFNKFCLKH